MMRVPSRVGPRLFLWSSGLLLAITCGGAEPRSEGSGALAFTPGGPLKTFTPAVGSLGPDQISVCQGVLTSHFSTSQFDNQD